MSYLSYLVGSFVAVFVIVDPFAVIPVYLTVTSDSSEDERRIMRRKANVIAFFILFSFAVTGTTIFNLFGITLPAFQIAGGILLLLLGISQLNAKSNRLRLDEQSESLEKHDISVFPLATPLLAGPGAISTVVLQSSEATNMGKLAMLCTAIFLTLFISNLILKGSKHLQKIMGKTGLNILTRIMGIILTAIAVQHILTGVEKAIRAMNFNN
jgi:multiple antibiotic resistance protein